ncbi:MAG: hypothetical protein ACREPX_03380 [Rhodanobacteraceae bacterium]
MAIVNINVAVTPKGTNITQGVSFAFSAGSGTPSGVVSSDGKIDLTKQYAFGTSVTLVFLITTSTVKFTQGTSVGTFPLAFYVAGNGAKDACWIAPYGSPPAPYTGTEFTFAINAMGPGNGSLTITDNNDDGNSYAYALWVWTTLQGASGQRFEDDPRIINHPHNK